MEIGGDRQMGGLEELKHCTSLCRARPRPDGWDMARVEHGCPEVEQLLVEATPRCVHR